MMRFCFKIVHAPGKALVLAVALARAPVHAPSAAEEKAELADHFLCMVVNALPATPKCLAEKRACVRYNNALCSKRLGAEAPVIAANKTIFSL